MTVIVAEFKGTQKVVADLKNLSAKVVSGLETILDNTAQEAKYFMRGFAPKDEGTLRDAIDVTLRKKGHREIGVGGSMGTKGNPLPARYAIILEDGARAHWPNISNLRDKFGLSASEAYLMAKGISTKPTIAHKFGAETFKRISPFFERAVENFLAKVVR